MPLMSQILRLLDGKILEEDEPLNCGKEFEEENSLDLTSMIDASSEEWERDQEVRRAEHEALMEEVTTSMNAMKQLPDPCSATTKDSQFTFSIHEEVDPLEPILSEDTILETVVVHPAPIFQEEVEPLKCGDLDAAVEEENAEEELAIEIDLSQPHSN